MPAFHWFLPTSGDGHQVGAATVTMGAADHTRRATLDYLTQVATAAEQAGFQAALRIEEYTALGLDECILSGWPHLEEAYRVGEHVLPLLR